MGAQSKVRDILNQVCDAFFVEKNLKKILTFAHENIYKIGTGIQEITKNKVELEQFIKEQFANQLESVSYEILEYEEKEIFLGIVHCLFTIKVLLCEEREKYTNVTLRANIVFVFIEEQVQIIEIHWSFLTQENEKRLSQCEKIQQLKKTEVPSQEEISNMLSKMMFGDFIEGYVEELKKDAFFDGLTGIYNRKKAVEEISEKQGKERNIAFFMIDIDNFKKVNDWYGHYEGDEVLRGLAQILRTQTRESDIVSRFGGDEFMIAIFNVRDESCIIKKAEEFQRSFQKEYKHKYSGCELSLSIGVVYSKTLKHSFKSLYREADKELYEVKNGGKDGISFRILEE